MLTAASIHTDALLVHVQAYMCSLECSKEHRPHVEHSTYIKSVGSSLLRSVHVVNVRDDGGNQIAALNRMLKK